MEDILFYLGYFIAAVLAIYVAGLLVNMGVKNYFWAFFIPFLVIIIRDVIVATWTELALSVAAFPVVWGIHRWRNPIKNKSPR